LFVFSGRQTVEFRLASENCLFVELAQERHAPPAASSCAAALRKLAGNARSLEPDETHQLASRDVKAVANLGIQIHDRPFESAESILTEQGLEPSFPATIFD
jgi:hypothetical protein